jgi:hypothetical protein
LPFNEKQCQECWEDECAEAWWRMVEKHVARMKGAE